MKNKYSKYVKLSLFLTLLFVSALTFGQKSTSYNKKGERQGIIRVKVSKSLATNLKLEPVTISKSGIISTGIKAMDALSSKYNATNMTRLFPEHPNSYYEAKLRKHGLDLWYEIVVDQTIDASSIAEQYQNLDVVSLAEIQREKVLSYSSPTTAVERKSAAVNLPFNDPYLQDQWHYNNEGQSGYAEGIDINLFSAWNETKGNNNIIVSIHDEGIDIEHEDLAENIWINEAELNGTPGVDDDNNGYIDDVNGWNFTTSNAIIDADNHGTHVAGTVAAVNNNGIGVSGVAGGSGNNDGAKLMPLKIIGGTANVANSFIYAANNGAVISQNSWGYSNPGVTEQSVRDAMKYFIEEAGDFSGSPISGGLLVFAAGNANSDNQWYPGFYPEAFTVSAVGPEGKKASYSNYGNWVDITAPGGDIELYGTKNGVLSTLPGNKIGYLDGTSMACPHVSGIAALALANISSQITVEELITKLTTGSTNIDQLNPNYIGKLGRLIDAKLAIQNNQNIAPETITDLNVVGMSQEFGTISWTVPEDTDDVAPYSYIIYYNNEEITEENKNSASKIEIENNLNAGEKFTLEIDKLYGLTTYYFAVVSLDRWGNRSDLSNIVFDTTNEGPSIAIDASSQDIIIDIDAQVNTLGSHNITILNEAEGTLRWEYESRHVSTYLANNSQIKYPEGNTKTASAGKVNQSQILGASAIATALPAPMSFTSSTLEYFLYASNVIGDEDLSVPNSSATKFTVNNADGFNLTEVRAYLQHDPSSPVIVEIYRGENLDKNNLLLSQNYTAFGDYEHTAYVTLDEQLYFNNGESFWVVFNVTAGTKYPLGIGPKKDPSDNSHENCLMSFDYGATWSKLANLISTEDAVWAVSAVSNNEYLGKYLTLDPTSGEVLGNEQMITTLSAETNSLINGTYKSNIVFSSNDGQKPELRSSVTVNIANHDAELSAVSELNYGSVFQGEYKEIAFTLANNGLGKFQNINISSSNPAFELVGYSPWSIAAKAETDIVIKYIPSSTTGVDNGILTINSSESNASVEIVLFGVSTEPGKLKVTPLTQTIDNVTIGDAISATLNIENEGASTLKYFIPKYDTKGISDDWKTSFSKTGYKFKSNNASELEPIAYNFVDISTTGTNITQTFKDDSSNYHEIDFGFDFPFYETSVQKLYVTYKGWATFSDDLLPNNIPTLGDAWGPNGFISPIGSYNFDLSLGGNVYYEALSDRLIVQFDNLSSYFGSITVQMVLFRNGDIRFYYDNIAIEEWAKGDFNILIEDIAKTDGIIYHNYENRPPFESGLAIGYDYPGPDIITTVENGSGILLPGESVDVSIEMSTASLVEGLTKRYINIISSDPEKSQESALININVTDGGTAAVSISETNIDLGEVFQGGIATNKFVLSNSGTAASTIVSFIQATNEITITGDTSGTITPGSSLVYNVNMPTDVIGNFQDIITITDSEANEYVVSITGSVVIPPAISIDLTQLDESLNFGEISSHELTIENTGAANLEVVANGNEWVSVGDKMNTNSNIPDFTYNVETSSDGSNYEWLDIRKKGVQLPQMVDPFVTEEFHREVTLQTPITFYGSEYSTIYIADNGVISFEKPNQSVFGPDALPSNEFNGLIAPLWIFGSIDTYNYTSDETGIFLLEDDEKTVVSWEYLINNFGGLGDPVSAQVIFYKNGTMKFQYNVREFGWDASSDFSIVGIESPDKTDVVLISNRASLNHGDGLSFLLTPAKKHTILPGETLTTYINFDSNGLYAGYYSDQINFRTNVPGQEEISKPVSLEVFGSANLESTLPEVAYNNVMADGSSLMREFDVTNTGKASVAISSIALESVNANLSVEIYEFVPGWFPWDPGFYQWSNIEVLWNFPMVVSPNENLKFRVTYTPDTAENLTNNLVITSDIDPFLIPISATATLPPVFETNHTEVISNINERDGLDTQIVTISNANGGGELTFDLSIDYLRESVSSSTLSNTNSEAVTSFASNKKLALFTTASNKNKTSSSAINFNRQLAHDDKTNPETFVGFQGLTDFIGATRFNAGEQGFTLSHVQTFIKADELLASTIEYEIRTGGTNISNAKILGSGSANYELVNEQQGLITLALEEKFELYPNEDFYVILSYPFDLDYPQGVVTEIEDVAGRFMLLDGGSWYDLQEIYANHGWMVRALEETYNSNVWIQLDAENATSAEAGSSEEIKLNFFAEHAERGDQNANLIIRTNDVNNEETSIPVTLHVNEAPKLINKPTIVVINEGEVMQTEIGMEDPEGHVITAKLENQPSWVSFNTENNMLTITKTPDYNHEGVHEIDVVLVDEHNASYNTTLIIEVMNTNRAPEIIFTDDLEYNSIDVYDNLTFDTFFTDPDGDDMTFSIHISDKSIVNNFNSDNGFVIHTLKVGTTILEITATDSYGSITQSNINVTVSNALNTHDYNVDGLRLFPNPVSDLLHVSANTAIHKIEVYDINGKRIISNRIKLKENATKINVSNLKTGIYIFRAFSEKGVSTIRFIKK